MNNRNLSSEIASKMGIQNWLMWPLGKSRLIRAQIARAEDLTVSRVSLMPNISKNQPIPGYSAHYYVIYSANKPHYLKLDDQEETQLRPEELTVLDLQIPFEVRFSGKAILSSFIIDGALFERLVPFPASLIGRKLSDIPEINVALSNIIDMAVKCAARGNLHKVNSNLVTSFLNLIAVWQLTDSASIPTHRATLQDRCQEVKVFINRAYASPTLSVVSIAHAMNISTRYLSKALALENTSPQAYLRKCRLEAVAAKLRDQTLRRRSITDIALSCGFNSSAHFSNTFKRSYGVTPRSYRTGHL